MKARSVLLKKGPARRHSVTHRRRARRPVRWGVADVDGDGALIWHVRRLGEGRRARRRGYRNPGWYC